MAIGVWGLGEMGLGWCDPLDFTALQQSYHARNHAHSQDTRLEGPPRAHSAALGHSAVDNNGMCDSGKATSCTTQW